MWLRNCPSPELLLEVVSIPNEMSKWSLLNVRAHTLFCSQCEKTQAGLKATWEAYFQPQPEIASSLLKVYSRLQRDETLILKGWKLTDLRSQATSPVRLFFRSWGFPSGIAVALGLFSVFYSPDLPTSGDDSRVAQKQSQSVPLSAIRVRDRNSVKVHYVQPELLHSMEFETVSTP
jgi:hypothetical protein